MHIIGKKYLKNVKDDIRIYILGQIVGLSAIFIRKQTPAHEFIRIEVKNQAWHTPKGDDAQMPARHAGTSRSAEVGQRCSIY